MGAFLFAGCGREAEVPPATDGAASDPAAAESVATPEEAATEKAAEPVDAAANLKTAREALEAGKVDEAAAHLAQLQLQGASFSAPQARDYRQALSEAYDRALEAVQRGDSRGEAALQLLRAAGPK